MRIACVNLKSSFLINDKVFPPLGILYIAAALRKEGHEPVWYDFAGGNDYKIVDENIVFITVTSPQIPIAIMYVEEFCKGKKVVIGGCGVSSLTKEQKKLFNVIIKGEAEVCVDYIVKLAHSKTTETMICKVVNLDEVEFPARDLIEGYEYKIARRNATTMITSRGCPHNCIFCVDGSIKGFRMASVKKVCKEIDEIYELNYRAIMFFDDIFTLQKDRLKSIVSYLSCKGFLYRCFTHVNSVNIELCTILADSGCIEVGIGAESGSNTILTTIKKGFTRNKSIEVIHMLNDFGIKVKAFLVLGFPGESYITLEDTKDWLKKVKLSDVDIALFNPYPNTEIYNNKYNYNISWNGKNAGFFKGKAGKYKPFVSTSHLSAKDLVKQRDLIEREFK